MEIKKSIFYGLLFLIILHMLLKTFSFLENFQLIITLIIFILGIIFSFLFSNKEKYLPLLIVGIGIISSSHLISTFAELIAQIAINFSLDPLFKSFIENVMVFININFFLVFYLDLVYFFVPVSIIISFKLFNYLIDSERN